MIARMIAAVVATGFLTTAAAAAPASGDNLLQAPDFESPSDAWASMGPNHYRVLADDGRDGSRGLRYQKVDERPGENSHYDQLVAVEPNTWYVAGAWFKSDGGLEPMLRIADLDWQDVAIAEAKDASDWQLVEALFNSGDNHQLRFQIFGGTRDRRRESLVGTSFCDDVFLRKANEEDQRRFHRCNVTLDAGRVLRTIDTRFFGSNSLFMVEDDQTLTDGRIAQLLSEMPCRLLRYPGGDVADNYLWKTHRLDDPHHWPGIQGPQTTDTDEFMAFCHQAGAEPIFVANLESGFVHDDVDAAARSAADWVDYCNRKHDYGVKYWEIGNETYLYSPGRHKRARVTAEEYGRAFVKFARAMKAVDPTIRLGAIGPMEADSVRNVEGDEPRRPWWPTVLETAGPHVDFAVVHRYYGGAELDLARLPSNPFDVGTPVAELRRFFKETLDGRELPVALTEWNIGRNCPLKGMAAGVAIATLAVNYLDGGVDMANFWPLENPGSRESFRALVDSRTHDPQAAYRVLQLLAKNTRNKLLQSSTSKAEVTTMATLSDDGRTLSLVLVNRSLYEGGMEVALDTSGLSVGSADAQALTAPEPQSEELSLGPLPVEEDAGRLSLRLPPLSIAVVTLTRIVHDRL